MDGNLGGHLEENMDKNFTCRNLTKWILVYTKHIYPDPSFRLINLIFCSSSLGFRWLVRLGVWSRPGCGHITVTDLNNVIGK